LPSAGLDRMASMASHIDDLAAFVAASPTSYHAVPCGSTIGPLTATRLGIVTVDVGIPLLSMHSARELCGVADPGYLAQALVAYWAGA
jgi:aspartyl aminopeptidase